MKNHTNFIFALTIFIALVSGCKYSYGLKSDERTDSQTIKKTAKNSSDRKTFDNRQDNDADSDEENVSTVSGDTKSLAGKWIWTRTGNSTVSDSGVYAGGNGSRFTYEFSEDGGVKYTGAMSTQNGGCQMLVTSVSEGQATLDGDRLSIEWQPGSTTREDSCSSSQNYTKETPAETQDLTIRFQEKSGQEQLCLIEKEETCFSRAE